MSVTIMPRKRARQRSDPCRFVKVIDDGRARFPVRIRIAVPPGGLGRRHAQIIAWFDENCGSDGWAITPSGIRGVLNDVISLYFADKMLASAFVARRCVGTKVETAAGLLLVREGEPAPQVEAVPHRIP